MLGGVVLLAAVTLVGLRVARADTALPGMAVAGVDVGGLDREALTAALARVGASDAARTVLARQGQRTVTTTAEELGYGVDIDATVEAVLARGRQGNPLLALRDQLRASFSTIAVAPVVAFDADDFAAWVDRIALELALPPLTGELVFTAGSATVVVPEPGETIDVDGLRQRALDALDGTGDVEVEVPTTITTPTTTPEQVAALESEAERAISGPVTLRRGAVALTLAGEDIARLLEVRVPAVSGGGGGVGELELAIDPDALLSVLPAEQFAGLASDPQDAGFEVVGGQVRLVPGVDGFAFDARAAAAQVLQVATSPGPRSAELEGGVVEPELTTADAQALGITEEVASFTTEHPCCQSRVVNIQRIADLVDGTVVLPGATFSLNGHVGRRTVENGFTDGGAISGGEFVEQIGGGVSQFTTTMFNTIFFGGYEIVEFKPHSYYISRYPLGREATLNFDPPVDLRFTNDSPYGIYVHTSYTDTSITVTFFSTRWTEVTSTTGERYGFTEPEERREETDELPAGEERLVQSGRQGFSVDFTRTITYLADGREVTQRFTTVYLPEPRLTLVGTGDPTASESPSPTPDPDPDPDPDPGPDPPQPGPDPSPGEPTPPPAPTPTADPPPPPEPSPTAEPAPRPTGEPAPTPAGR